MQTDNDALVRLIDYTGKGQEPNAADYAARLLITVKNTRLERSVREQSVRELTQHEVNEELNHIASTIPSSWEFVHYIFEISNVSRIFTHQLVRHRNASFAEMSTQIMDVSEGGEIKGENNVVIPDEMLNNSHYIFNHSVNMSFANYHKLLLNGLSRDAARRALPLGTKTSIIMSINLRILVELIRSRSSLRNMKEMRNVVVKPCEVATAVHPFFKKFLNYDETVLEDIEGILTENNVKPYDRARMYKAIDRMTRK